MKNNATPIDIYEDLYLKFIDHSTELAEILGLEDSSIELNISVYKLYVDIVNNSLLDYNTQRTYYEIIKLFDKEFAAKFNEKFLSIYASKLIDSITAKLYNAYNILYESLHEHTTRFVKFGHADCSKLLEKMSACYRTHLEIDFDHKINDKLNFYRKELQLELEKKPYYVLLKNIDKIQFRNNKNAHLNSSKSIVFSFDSYEWKALKSILAEHKHVKELIKKTTPKELIDSIINEACSSNKQ